MKPKRLVPFLLVFVILVNSVGLVFADDTTNYTYDANGNLISDGVQCFTYNDANQLAAARTCAGNVLVAEYIYDHTGQRIAEKHYQNGALQETVYTIGKHTETVVAASGGRQDSTYYRSNNEIVARKNPDSSKNFYHQDHLGSTGALTDAGGQLVEETRYYPFGAVRSGGALSRFLYTGQESDAETGLYYYGARFYNPALARFVQPDSLLPAPYDPQTLNRYSYVENNPIIRIDPAGNVSISLSAIWNSVVSFLRSLSQASSSASSSTSSNTQPSVSGPNSSNKMSASNPTVRTDAPKAVELNDSALESSIDSCALYAQQRRPDLGPAEEEDGSILGTTGAYRYIYMPSFANSRFQISSEDNLYTTIGVGYAIVWDRGVGGMDSESGHIAIVESVDRGGKYVWVSERGMGNQHSRQISREELEKKGVWILR